jgi:hypothetical protein
MNESSLKPTKSSLMVVVKRRRDLLVLDSCN